MTEYQVPAYTEQPPKKGKGCVITVLIVGLLSLVFMGSCAGFVWFGMKTMKEQVKTEVAADPNVSATVGDVQEVKMDVVATGEAGKEKKAGSGEVIVFRITGSEGSGRVKVRVTKTGEVEVLEFTPDE